MVMRDFDTLWDRKTYISIKENFKELFNYYIKSGLDAAEAREKAIQAVADAEIAKETAETTREEMLAIIREQTQNGDLAPEIAQARQGKATLGDNLNSIKSDLAQTDDKLNVRNWELNSKARQQKGFTIFRSDDGRIEELTVAFPIFQSKGVPLNIAVVSDWVGNNNFLSQEQLLELQNKYGWEILSHSKTHPTTSAGKTLIPDLPESEARREFEESKNDLIRMGLNVQSYAHVGGQYKTRDRRLTREYYRSAMVSDRGRFGGLNKLPLESHELKTYWLDPTSVPLRTYLEQYDKATAIRMALEGAYEAIDRANAEGGIAIIGTHFQHINDPDYEEMFRDAIDYAKSKTKVSTLRDALNNTGNIIEVGDYASSVREDRQGGGHFVVAANGFIDGGATVAGLNEFGNNTPWDKFPHGMTIAPFNNGLAQGFPVNAGVLLNFKTRIIQFGFNYQKIHPYRSSDSFHRFVNTSGGYSNWESEGDIRFDDSFDLDSPITAFTGGVTYTRISSDHPNIGKMPLGAPGVIKTVRLKDNVPWGFHYQEVHLNFENELFTFKRRPTSSDEWSSFKQTSTRIYTESQRGLDAGIGDYSIGETYEEIGNSHPDISKTPGGHSGILKTVKVTDSGRYGMNYEEFRSYGGSYYYQRTASGADTWNKWFRIGLEEIN